MLFFDVVGNNPLTPCIRVNFIIFQSSLYCYLWGLWEAIWSFRALLVHAFCLGVCNPVKISHDMCWLSRCMHISYALSGPSTTSVSLQADVSFTLYAAIHFPQNYFFLLMVALFQLRNAPSLSPLIIEGNHIFVMGKHFTFIASQQWRLCVYFDPTELY